MSRTIMIYNVFFKLKKKKEIQTIINLKYIVIKLRLLTRLKIGLWLSLGLGDQAFLYIKKRILFF